MKLKKATFAAGCFWHVQLDFSKMLGVIKTTAGYTSGKLKNPTYEKVSKGQSGHLEAVELEYDEENISYEQLLEKFFTSHDPTTLNRQGPDIGTQYTSAIFYHSKEQKQKAEEYKEKLIKQGINVVTIIKEAGPFYPAEEYHQNYLKKRDLNTCSLKQAIH